MTEVNNYWKNKYEEEKKSHEETQKKYNALASEKCEDKERISKAMVQQLADFDVMKKTLMRDLQNRCEKVTELEIRLDEARAQNQNALRNTNNKIQQIQQRKMAFLERNNEQLINVQRQLIEQNSSLKREIAIAERKLLARNERIQSLEALLQDAWEKNTVREQKFEAQLQAVRERLEQSRKEKSQSPFFGRIVRPVRRDGDTSKLIKSTSAASDEVLLTEQKQAEQQAQIQIPPKN